MIFNYSIEDATRSTSQKYMRKLLLSIFVLLFAGCGQLTFKQNLLDAIAKNQGGMIDLATLTAFEWDTLTIVGPYWSKSENIPGLDQKLRDRIRCNDDICLLVFRKNGRIVLAQVFERKNGDFSYKSNYQEIQRRKAKYLVRYDKNRWCYLVNSSNVPLNTISCIYATTDTNPALAESQPRRNCAYVDNGKIFVCDSTISKLTFSESGLAAILTEEYGWLFVRTDGSTIRTVTFDNGPDYLAENYYRYIDNGRMGFVNDSGRIIIEAKYTFAFPFEGGYAVVCNDCESESDGEHSSMKRGTWGCINSTGAEIIPVKYSEEDIGR